jgi:hypothetical protein
MRWWAIWISIILVVSCGDSESGGGGRKRDRDDKGDKDDKKDKSLSCEDAVDGFTRDKDKKADMVKTCIKNEWSRRMKKCVSEAESRADVRACERKHDAARSNEMWDKLQAYADTICVCRNMDCVTKAGEEWAKQAAELAKEAGGRVGEMNEEDKRKSEEITKKITDCMKRLTDDMTRTGAGSGGW